MVDHMVLEYQWKHLPTGREGTANFTAYDAHEAGCVFYNGLPHSYALTLLERWNTSLEWRHSLTCDNNSHVVAYRDLLGGIEAPRQSLGGK